MITLNVHKIDDSDQYVVCENTWSDVKCKYVKIPVNPYNYSDRSAVKDSRALYPLTFENALAIAMSANFTENGNVSRYYSVGYVLHPDSGVFCIDLDNFDNIPEYIATNFPNGMYERSVSGTGWHIWGRLPQGHVVPAHKEHSKAVNGVEFYSRSQFIALGSYCQGELTVVDPQLVANFIEYYRLNAEEENIQDPSYWTTGPFPDYFPGDVVTDDDVLAYLSKHVSNKQEFSSMTQNSKDISFQMRFNLPQHCIDEPGRYSPYISRSEVDQSVFIDLMYACGGDCDRVFRIASSNPLFFRTDKPIQYTTRSIIGALDHLKQRPEGQRFLVFKKAEVAAKLAVVESSFLEEGFTNEALTVEVMDLKTMVERFVHIAEGAFVLDMKNNSKLKLTDAAKLMASSVTVVEVKKKNELTGRPETANKGVSTLDLWMRDVNKLSARNVTFEPRPYRFVTDDEGNRCFNIYRPPVIAEGDGNYDITYFHQHIAALFRERADDFLDWLAHMVQKPWELPHTHWLHISNRGGTGRGRLCNLISAIVQYGKSVTVETLFESQFNEWRNKLIFGFVEEMGSKNIQADRDEVYRKLKEFSTADKLRFNDKGEKAHHVKNFSRWMFNANRTDAIKVPGDDRRLDVVYLDDDMCAEINVADGNLEEHYTNPKFIKAVRYFLSQRDISKYNHRAHAKMTTAKKFIVNENIKQNYHVSAGELGNAEAVNELYADVKDFLTNYEGPDMMALQEIIRHIRPDEMTSRNGAVSKHIVTALKTFGCTYITDHRYFVPSAPGNKNKIRKHIWILRNRSMWKEKLHHELLIQHHLEIPIVYNLPTVEGSSAPALPPPPPPIQPTIH